MEIIPAIIGKTFKEVKEKIERVDGLADWVQLDIMDGLFVPPYTWQNPDDLHEIDGKIKIEVHLMAEQPEVLIEDWLPVADRIIVHIEATDNLEEIVTKLAHRPNMLGVALKLETPIEALNLYPGVHVVQLMGIAEIGYHHHPFDRRVVDKIRALRAQLPNATIQIDGGVTLETGQECLEAGADNLVVGSALWDSGDLENTVKEFQKLTAR